MGLVSWSCTFLSISPSRTPFDAQIVLGSTEETEETMDFKLKALREAAINQSLNHLNCVRTFHYEIRPIQASQVYIVQQGEGRGCTRGSCTSGY